MGPLTPTIIKIGAGILAVLIFHLVALAKAHLSISSCSGDLQGRKPKMSDLFRKSE